MTSDVIRKESPKANNTTVRYPVLPQSTPADLDKICPACLIGKHEECQFFSCNCNSSLICILRRGRFENNDSHYDMEKFNGR